MIAQSFSRPLSWLLGGLLVLTLTGCGKEPTQTRAKTVGAPAQAVDPMMVNVSAEMAAQFKVEAAQMASIALVQ